MAQRFLENSGVVSLSPVAGDSASKSSSFFADVSVAPPNAIFLTKEAHDRDPAQTKLDLGIGAYRTEEGKPLVLNVVRKAEEQIHLDKTLNKEYLPIGGMAQFIGLAQQLILGKESPALKQKRVAGVQALSGTGALRVLCEFLKFACPHKVVFMSRPTWANHGEIVARAGLKGAYYQYWNPATRGLDLEAMLSDIEHAPDGSVIMLHACAHNPTGVDPTMAQWRQIMALIKRKNHLTFFDSAYQGFATGDLDADAAAVRMFVENGMECLIAQSFAKNLGLYGERIGCASIVCRSPAIAAAVDSQMRIVVRPMYSNPPVHGARIVVKVLGNPQLFEEWKKEMRDMSGRIKEMRQVLFDELKKLGTPSISGDWSHIKSQIGMFSYTGLTAAQVDNITKRHHVYMLKDGRISMAGLNRKNVAHMAKAMDDVIRNP